MDGSHMSTTAPDPDDRLYTVSEIAKKFKVTPYTVRQWIKDGLLIAIKPSGQWRVTHAEFVAFANDKYGAAS